jgi:LPXTG-motif cell wall-anchored protein
MRRLCPRRVLLATAAGAAVGLSAMLAVAAPASASPPIPVSGHASCDTQTGGAVVVWEFVNSESRPASVTKLVAVKAPGRGNDPIIPVAAPVTDAESITNADGEPVTGVTVPARKDGKDGTVQLSQRFPKSATGGPVSLTYLWDRAPGATPPVPLCTYPEGGGEQVTATATCDTVTGNATVDWVVTPRPSPVTLTGVTTLPAGELTYVVVGQGAVKDTVTGGIGELRLRPNDKLTFSQTVPAGTTSVTLSYNTREVNWRTTVALTCTKGAAAAASPAANPPGAASTLPKTGNRTGILIGAGAVLLAGGVGVYLVARRRRIRFQP